VLAADEPRSMNPDLLLDRVDALLLGGRRRHRPGELWRRADTGDEGTWPEREPFELR